MRKTVAYIDETAQIPSIQEIDKYAKRAPLSLIEYLTLLKECNDNDIPKEFSNYKAFITQNHNINYINPVSMFVDENSKLTNENKLKLLTESNSDTDKDLDDYILSNKERKFINNYLKLNKIKEYDKKINEMGQIMNDVRIMQKMDNDEETKLSEKYFNLIVDKW